MKIFVSYASENRPEAEKIAIGLRNDGHKVFYDRDDQRAGDEYNRRIREEIARARLLLFLASPASLREGKYTLTEMELFRKRWPAPSGRVLTVILDRPAGELDAYLAANTFLEPRGNLVAEVLARVAEIEGQHRRDRRKRLVRILGAAAVLFAGAAVLALVLRDPDGSVVEEPCHLTVAVQSGNPGGWPGDALLFDITHVGATGSFSASREGSAPVDVGPLTEATRAWTIAVKDSEGRVMGERTLEGCPDSRSSYPLGGNLELVVAPR